MRRVDDQLAAATRRPGPPRLLEGFLAVFVALASVASSVAHAESTAGLDFWFAWPETPDVTVSDATYDLDAALILIAPHGPVSVRVLGPGLDVTVAVDPSAASVVRLPRAAAMVTARDVPLAAGIDAWTESCTPFAALFRVPGTGASVGDDMLRLLPTPLLNRSQSPVAYKGLAEFIIVAVEDGTELTVSDPNCSSPPPQLLDRGDVFLHGCVDPNSDVDVTGTLVQASKPVAMITGSAESRVIHHRVGPAELFFSHADVLLESPWPIELQGRVHAHAPFRHDNPAAIGDLVRVVNACPGNELLATESDGDRWTESFLARGEFSDLEVWDPLSPPGRLVDGGALILTEEPALVATYTVGHDGAGAAGVGDPSMSTLDPVSRWEREVVAWLPEGYWNSVAIVSTVGAEATVRVDGVAPVGLWQAIGDGSLFSWLRLDDVPAGLHRIEADEPIFVEVSGYLPAMYGAYSHPAIPLRGDALPSVQVTGLPTCGREPACPGSPVQLGVEGSWTSYTWSTGETTPEIVVRPTVTAEITVEVRDSTGCLHAGAVVIDVDGSLPPLAVTGPDEICEGDCVVLEATPGYDSYDWDTGDSGPDLLVCPDVETIYTVTAMTASGCESETEFAVAPLQYPVAGAASARVALPCGLRVELSWEEAEWRPGSAGGVYNIYRRSGACAPLEDPSWELLVSGLSALVWLDETVVPGSDYSYLIEPEDEPGTVACRPGPSFGGPTNRTCATPESVVPPGDPDLPLLEGLSPFLRALGYERPALGRRPTSVTFGWPGAPPLAPRTFIEVQRADQPRLVPHDHVPAAASWRDEDPAGADLYFYRFYNVTACGSRIE